MHRIFRSLTLACAALGAAAAQLAAQNPTAAQRPGRAPAAPPAALAQYMTGGAIAQYLVDHPRALNLTSKQVDQARKLAKYTDSVNAPLRAQWEQLTGGKALRDLDSATRHRIAPQLQSIRRLVQVNDAAAFDSVDTILNPRQQERLATLREEYRARLQARPGSRPRQQPQ